MIPNIAVKPITLEVEHGGRTMKFLMTVPWFYESAQSGGGLLPDTNAAMACFYYYVCCEMNLAQVGKHIEDQPAIEYDIHAGIMDMPLWNDKRFAAIAKGITKLYGLDAPEQMFAHWPQVTLECMRVGLPIPQFEYMNPPSEDRIT